MKKLFVSLGLTLLFLTACGVKGDLQLKGEPSPQPPAAFTLKQQGDEMLLSWNPPTLNQDGSPLTDLTGFRIDLYTYHPDRFCQECRDQETIASIRVVNPAPAFIKNNTIYYRDSGLDLESGYRYRVYPFTDSGQVGPTAEARRTMLPPPAAPEATRAEELDRGIRLFWNLPDNIQEYGELLGVNIYQGESNTAFDPDPVNVEPVKGNNFDHFGLNNGTTYHYALRSVILADKQVVESALSPVIEATPESGL